jgi:hypothetical protein
VTSIHGRRLINRSAIALLKAHRFARQAGEVELDLADTMRVLEVLREIVPGPASIDVARLVARYADAVGEGDAIPSGLASSNPAVGVEPRRAQRLWIASLRIRPSAPAGAS